MAVIIDIKKLRDILDLQKIAKNVVPILKQEIPVSALSTSSGGLRDSVITERKSQNEYWIGPDTDKNIKVGIRGHISTLLITGRGITRPKNGKYLVWKLSSGKSVFMKQSPVNPNNIKYPLKDKSVRYNQKNEYIDRAVSNLQRIGVESLVK